MLMVLNGWMFMHRARLPFEGSVLAARPRKDLFAVRRNPGDPGKIRASSLFRFAWPLVFCYTNEVWPRQERGRGPPAVQDGLTKRGEGVRASRWHREPGVIPGALSSGPGFARSGARLSRSAACASVCSSPVHAARVLNVHLRAGRRSAGQGGSEPLDLAADSLCRWRVVL